MLNIPTREQVQAALSVDGAKEKLAPCCGHPIDTHGVSSGCHSRLEEPGYTETDGLLRLVWKFCPCELAEEEAMANVLAQAQP